MDIAEIIKEEGYLKRLQENGISHAMLFQSMDDRLNKVMLIMTALSINYKTYELFNEESAEYLKIKNNADIDIKIYPKNNEKLLVSDSNEITDEVYIKPAEHDNKVFIINNIEASTEQAQNKLLKVLEEPPKNVYFLISCQDDNRVLQTIKSRCQKIVLEKLPKEKFDLICKNPLASMISEGYIGLYEEYSKKANLEEVVETTIKLVTELKNSGQVLKFSTNLMKYREDIELIFQIYIRSLEDMIKIKSEREDLCSMPLYLDSLKSVESEFSINAICEINSLVSEFIKKREANVNEQVALENLLLKILEVKYICK